MKKPSWWIRCAACSIAFTALLCSAALAQNTAVPGERLALVIGNSAYPKAPLANPANDAKAMSALLTQAGFNVTELRDTSQTQLSEAVAKFGLAIKDPKVKFGLFYYAGHGLQLEWRNYLVPVSANVRSAVDVKAKAVDVSTLLTYMEEAKGRTFLIILDACRDDPFAGLYKPSAAGLSQFDAPPGSLLAFSTSPGKVALDGVGNNGLYTANLLREFAVQGVRLEDAFKRVRLSVRMASNGAQIPWESTSLEDDVFLFPSEKVKLTEAQQDQLLEQEFASWQRLKTSKNSQELAGFIRQYPSGSASELAQARLSRLLNELAVQHGARQRAEELEAERAEARAQAEQKIVLAARHAEIAQAQNLAAQRAEEARQNALAVTQANANAQREAERLDATKAAQAQAEATRAAEQQLQAAQAVAASVERERMAAVAAQRALLAQAQEQAKERQIELAQAAKLAELDKIAQAKAEADRLEAARLVAARFATEQADALARAQTAERQAAIKAAAQAQQAEQRAAAAAALEVQNRRAVQIELARLAQEKQNSEAALAAQKVLLAEAEKNTVTAPVSAVQILTATPYFKGLQEHARTFQKGDLFNYQVVDGFNKSTKPLNLEVTSVDVDADRVEYNGGDYVSDTMGNVLVNPRGGFNTPRQFYPAELYVGKKWISIFKQARPGGITYTYNYTLKVVARETVTVPAGTFETFKIEARGFNMQLNARLERNIWVAPGISGDIAHETLVRLRSGAIEQNDRQELVAFRQAGLRTASR